MKVDFWTTLAAAAVITAMPAAENALAQTVMNEHRLQSSSDEGIELYLRERLPEGKSAGDLDGAVLFLHGATYPGVTFDTDLADGKSWMDHTAEAGYATYYLDKRGYGHSTRPEMMRQPPKENEPFARAETVINDIDDAVDFIRENTGADKVHLVGWSWGTVTGGMYTSRNSEKVDRLVLFAPVYSYENEMWTSRLADLENPDELGDVGAYRTVTREEADERWARQIPGEDPTTWRDPEVFDRWYSDMLGMEPQEEVDHIKAPNGVLVDLWEVFHARPIYDASEITIPTLVIRGDDDPTSIGEDAAGLYGELGSEEKRYVVIGGGTHFVNLEKNAPQLFAETLLFLDGVDEALKELK